MLFPNEILMEYGNKLTVANKRALATQLEPFQKSYTVTKYSYIERQVCFHVVLIEPFLAESPNVGHFYF